MPDEPLQSLIDAQNYLDEIRMELDTAQEVRDDQIVDAFDDGYSLRDIGDALGLSHTAVRRIIQNVTGVKFLRPK